MSVVALQSCILCQSAAGLEVKTSPGMIDTAASGFAVWCTPCGLRGPWRATETEACKAWNRQVVPPTEEEKEV